MPGIRKYGLIGFPLHHSFSPEYFRKKFESESITDCRYDAYPLEDLIEVEQLLQNPEICGLNVTIPYKEKIIPYLNNLSPEAKEIGAVNTLVRSEIGWIGHNTDAGGFEKTLPVNPDSNKIALILGNGGASKAVKFVFKKLGIDLKMVIRTKDPNHLHYSDLNEELMSKAQYIVNTTPVGMYPNINDCPDIPYHLINDQHICYDLIYNPENTLFMQKSGNMGAMVINGLPMLIAQAEASWKLWNS